MYSGRYYNGFQLEKMFFFNLLLSLDYFLWGLQLHICKYVNWGYFIEAIRDIKWLLCSRIHCWTHIRIFFDTWPSERDKSPRTPMTSSPTLTRTRAFWDANNRLSRIIVTWWGACERLPGLPRLLWSYRTLSDRDVTQGRRLGWAGCYLWLFRIYYE